MIEYWFGYIVQLSSAAPILRVARCGIVQSVHILGANAGSAFNAAVSDVLPTLPY